MAVDQVSATDIAIMPSLPVDKYGVVGIPLTWSSAELIDAMGHYASDSGLAHLAENTRTADYNGDVIIDLIMPDGATMRQMDDAIGFLSRSILPHLHPRSRLRINVIRNRLSMER